jgi:hypothetical protein
MPCLGQALWQLRMMRVVAMIWLAGYRFPHLCLFLFSMVV